MIVIADNLQPLNPEIKRALDEKAKGPIQKTVKACEAAGAGMLDLNPGYLSARNLDRMPFLVETVQEVSSLPLVIDSPNPAVIAEGLKACRTRPIINALSLESEKLEKILPMAVEHQTDLVLLLMDERSMTPPRFDEKLALAIELREHCLAAGLTSDKLIFDPVMPALSWPDAFAQAADVIKTIRFLSSGAVFQESVRTMIGLSNLRSGQRHIYPPKLDEICLSMLAGAGLDYALVNVLQAGAMDAVSLISQML